MNVYKYLILPFEHLVIREDPLYHSHEERFFVLERVNSDLSVKKEYANKQADSIEDFFRNVQQDSFLKENQQRVFNHLNNGRWIAVHSEIELTLERAWPMAMEKLAMGEFYAPAEPAKTVPDIEQIRIFPFELHLYINDYGKVLAVLIVDDKYPNVIRDIDEEHELKNAWGSISLLGKPFRVNIWTEEKQYRAGIFALREDKPEPDMRDAIEVPVRTTTSKMLRGIGS